MAKFRDLCQILCECYRALGNSTNIRKNILDLVGHFCSPKVLRDALSSGEKKSPKGRDAALHHFAVGFCTWSSRSSGGWWVRMREGCNQERLLYLGISDSATSQQVARVKKETVMLEPVWFSSSIWNIRQACRDISLQQLEPCTAGVPEG